MKHRAIMSFVPALVASLAVGCAAQAERSLGDGIPNTVAVTIDPESIEVAPLSTTQFIAAVTGAAAPTVTWSVTESAGGTVDTTGLYTAPAGTGTFHVVARSTADTTAYATATVTVTTAPTPPATAACATAPLRTTGTRYYFCNCQTGAAGGCVAGDDSRDGTNPALPRKTLASAFTRFNSMNAGDTIALCRGGAWDESNLSSLNNQRCSASSEATWCEFRDYVPSWGSASTARPRLNVDGAAPAAFTLYSSGTHDGYRFWNLDLRMTSRGGGGRQPEFIFIWNDPPNGVRYNHVDMCNLSFTNSYIAVQGGGIGHTIRNSQFINCGWHGILGLDDYWTIDGNTFLNCGDQTVDPSLTSRHHAMYLIKSLPAHAQGTRVTNNYVHYDPDGTNGYGQCRGVAVILRGGQQDTVFENNYIEGYGSYPCMPFAVAASGEAAEHIRTIVRRNRIKWHGNPDILMQIDFCQDCVIESNLLESDTTLSGAALMVPSETAAHRSMSGTGITTRAVVRNNTVSIPGGPGIRVGNPELGTDQEGSGFIVENNVVATGSGATCTLVGWPTATGHPFAQTSYPSTTTNAAGNYCVANGAGAGVVFRAPASGDFRPLDPGPLIGTANQTSFAASAMGSVEWDPLDLGSVRVAPIDIGAYQR